MICGNAVVGQSGGPTAAINATLAGVIRGALANGGKIKTLYGMKNGIEGFLREDFINLSERFTDGRDLELLSHTPAAALGSCRKKLKAHDVDKECYEKIFEILKKYDIRYFFYIGGNDSMDTVLKLSKYAESIGYELYVVGVPKTIDNDLMATDHTPGYGSAAKFVASVFREFIRDLSVYTLKAVTVVEVMGRDAGWLTAASALTRTVGEDAPDLIYLPERVFDAEKFISDLKLLLEKKNSVLVAVSEGIKLQSGKYVGEGIDTKADAFGHVRLSGAGKVLEGLVSEKIGCKVRSIELSLTQRCAGHLLSATDINESLAIGENAVKYALEGKSGIMVSVIRPSLDDYYIEISYSDISKIANGVRRVPDEFINADGNGITDLGIKYLAPLILGEVAVEYENGLPKHFTF
jgi:6-phosphofructokinase 1